MLPGGAIPGSLAELLAVFRPFFASPTFRTFLGLVVGLIAQTRRRTVCGMSPALAWIDSGITAERTDCSLPPGGRAMRWDWRSRS
jgi:hypothetical protein